jgi:hypothetical protein
MAGFRNTIRERAVAALVDAGTEAGADVFSNRVDPVKADRLPLLSVSMGRERKATQGLMRETPEFRAVATLEVRAFAGGADIANVEDTLETLIDEVQNALLTSATFMATPILHIDAVEVDVEYNGQAAENIGFASITFDIAYLDEYEVIPGTND